MQSRDEVGNLVQSAPVDLSNLEDLVAKIKTAEEKGATAHTIAKLPKAGGIVELNGLSYRVDFADYVRGKFQVKLVLRG